MEYLAFSRFEEVMKVHRIEIGTHQNVCIQEYEVDLGVLEPLLH